MNLIKAINRDVLPSEGAITICSATCAQPAYADYKPGVAVRMLREREREAQAMAAVEIWMP